MNKKLNTLNNLKINDAQIITNSESDSVFR